MIKIFDSTDTDFFSAGNIIIEPIKCNETKKKSLNGWYIEVEIPIKYKEYIEKDKLCVVQTKSKLNPQAFRISEQIEYSTRKIKFKADHVMFDSKNYVLLDVRPTALNGLNGLNYINQRTDNVSPFTMLSNVEHVDTAYFIRKNLLEAWEVFEERWGGFFEADNWNISFLTTVGHDNGETIAYGKNMQGFDVFEDWSSVCTKLCPVGYDGLMLPEHFLTSDVQYEQPYTRVVDFGTDLDPEEQTEEALIEELRTKANTYLNENKYPKVSYTVISNINEKLEIGDIIKVLHPFVNIFTEVLEYEYNLISKKVVSITFGNYSKDVKTKFNNIKNTITQINETLSKQEVVINTQTNIINSLNKNGYVYIDDNEILILDRLPKEEAQNVWRFGLGGIGFSSNGYEGPFEVAMTMDGQINANFVTTGTMSVSRIEGLGEQIIQIIENVDTQNQKISQITQTVDEINQKISDIANITVTAESIYASVELDGINQSEPIYVKVYPTQENISYLYPRNNLYPSNTLFSINRKLRFHNTTTHEIFDYELPSNLLRCGEVYDEFILDYDSQICFVNKKVGYNADGTTYVLENSRIDTYPFPTIELTDGDYTVSLLGHENGYLFVRLMAKNIYTTQFFTKTETRSELEQTASDITASVNQKFTNYSTTLQMNSAIQLKANEITSSVSETYATKSTTNSLSTRISQTAKTIELMATDNGTSSGITIKLKNEDGTQIDSKSANITMSGLVKFTDLSGAGSTTINGSNITTGTINASKVTITNINASNITTGTISASKISGGSLNLTGTNTTIASTNFNVDKNGNMTCSNATVNGTINATNGTFQNCTITNSCTVPASTVNGTLATSNIPNLNASKITAGTMSGNRISGGMISGSSFLGLSVAADSISLNTIYGHYYAGSRAGITDYVTVPTSITVVDGKITAQTWKRLQFTGGILTAIQSSW